MISKFSPNNGMQLKTRLRHEMIKYQVDTVLYFIHTCSANEHLQDFIKATLAVLLVSKANK